jgi:hypothetical protein
MGLFIFSMDPKTQILSYIAQNPGLKTEEIKIGIKRASLGLHLRNLTDKGLVIKTQDNCWQVSSNYVMQKTVHKLSPMDLAEKHIREMIFCSDQR